MLQFWSLWADSYYCKQISVENGLSQSSVTDVIYDGRGALWIGTRFGLNEYRNGKLRVIMDDGSNRILGNYIYLLHNDAQGNLWVSTDKGLFRYDPSADSFSLISDNPVTRSIQSRASGLVPTLARDSTPMRKRLIRKKVGTPTQTTRPSTSTRGNCSPWIKR